MTTEEAVIRAQDKLNRGEVLDCYDVENLVNSVANTYTDIGYDTALEDVKRHLDRELGSGTKRLPQ